MRLLARSSVAESFFQGSGLQASVSDWPVVLKKGTGKLGVVLIHDITGLDPVNLSFADKLAAEGIGCAAVDVFRGHVVKDLQEGMAMRQKLTPEDLTSAVGAGVEALRREIGAGAVIGSMGFCMGGGIALHGACVIILRAVEQARLLVNMPGEQREIGLFGKQILVG